MQTEAIAWRKRKVSVVTVLFGEHHHQHQEWLKRKNFSIKFSLLPIINGSPNVTSDCVFYPDGVVGWNWKEGKEGNAENIVECIVCA